MNDDQTSIGRIRHTNEWNRIESPEINKHIYEQIFDKGAKNIQWRKESLFNKYVGKNGKHMQKKDTSCILSSYTKLTQNGSKT